MFSASKSIILGTSKSIPMIIKETEPRLSFLSFETAYLKNNNNTPRGINNNVAAIITGAVILKTKQNAMDKHLIELNYNELKEKVDNKESFILVVTQTTCSYCAEYKPVLKEVLYENDIYAYFIEKDKLTNEEKAKFNEIANVETTPQTLFFVDGAEESTQQRLVGNHPKNDIITKLKVKGYIK